MGGIKTQGYLSAFIRQIRKNLTLKTTNHHSLRKNGSQLITVSTAFRLKSEQPTSKQQQMQAEEEVVPQNKNVLAFRRSTGWQTAGNLGIVGRSPGEPVKTTPPA